MHHRLLCLSLLACLTLLLQAGDAADHKSSHDDGPIVDLQYALYRGSTDPTSKITTFLGIRYAAPPIGLLRFQSPRQPASIKAMQNAISFPPQCYQSEIGLANISSLVSALPKRDFEPVPTNTSEDCLFLDVVVPDIETARGLPVVVWIHGGGYASGNISVFTQSDLTAHSNNHAITVLIQYRLGAFGFLAGPEVKKHGALNAGLLDQNFALQWVQKYISSVSSSPAIRRLKLLTSISNAAMICFTLHNADHDLFYAAGAGSVLQHVVAHGGRTQPPLFRAAITSSTALPSQYPGDGLIPSVRIIHASFLLEIDLHWIISAQILYNELANITGCLAPNSNSASFACLVALGADALGEANYLTITRGFYGTTAFAPVIDGEFIVERPTVTLGRVRVNGEVLLAVTNTFEGRTFVLPNLTTSIASISAYTQAYFPLLDAAQANQVAEIYAASALEEELPTAEDQAVAIIGESVFICPTYYLLRAFKGRSWKGEFAIPPGIHGEDVYYYFSSAGQPFNNTAFITAFAQSFLDVVRFLDPNAKFESHAALEDVGCCRLAHGDAVQQDGRGESCDQADFD
ncbi:alpha/beta-hydrolase [Athelia psychrophila]|uniref:Alpha/beta-hydrolase n=1 Tax=Athelia psychrophila TaxID=1759441 RepID=A0A166PVE6_9AGAM|nr:alpha/beta-hydrolase [Fibularhizoctonia sp. CBS 109695]